MYPDVILGGRNLSGTSLYNFKVEERHCFLHDWLKAEAILLPAFNSKMFFFPPTFWTDGNYFEKNKNKKTFHNTFVLTSKMHNMPRETQSSTVFSSSSGVL